jgi:arylsulfatase A-like enzyme
MKSQIRRWLCFSLAVILGFNLDALRAEDKTREANPPNVLFILVDDQSPWDLKIYNPSSPLDSPNIDRLAREGVVIDGAYHMGSFSGAVCTPSRHMIMSGRSLWHLPISPEAKRRNLTVQGLESQTIPAVFGRAGYVTMRTCKEGNSFEGANKQFAIRHDSTKRGGTAETGSAWHADRVLDFLTDWSSKRAAKDSTETVRVSHQPFLIYFGFSHPHDVRDGTPELLAKYGASNHRDRNSLPPSHPNQPKLPENYLPIHPFPHGHPNLRDEVDVEGVWERRDEQTIRNELGREFACSENIDIQIGRVLDRLDQIGELENTLVVYTADHGMAIGRHGLQGKQNLYEHTWRVPMVVKGPGVPSGRRAQGNVYLMDLLATLCDFTGIESPATNEGTSFRSVVVGDQDVIRDVVYGVYNGGTKPGQRCVKQGDWKLIEWDVLDGTVRRTQLFNLRDNPLELLTEHHAQEVTSMTGMYPSETQINLADDVRYAAKLKEMQDLLHAQMQRWDDPWKLWNQ